MACLDDKSRFVFLESLCDFDGHIAVQAIGDDVFLAKLFLDAAGDELGSSQLHLVGDGREVMHVQPPEDAWENQRVVDLVLVVAPSASIDECSCFVCFFWQDFWVWVGHRENYAVFVHLLQPFLLQSSGH